MRNRKLNKNEIDAINLFMSTITDIDVVEGVYLVPYVEKSNKKGVRVITIYNTEPKYLEELNGGNQELTKIAYTNLHTTINNYNGFFQNTTDISFFANDAKNYDCSSVLSHAKKMSLQSLASGTILFDRYGNIEKTRFNAFKYVKPYTEAVLLRNIDKIIPEHNSIQYQKKD